MNNSNRKFKVKESKRDLSENNLKKIDFRTYFNSEYYEEEQESDEERPEDYNYRRLTKIGRMRDIHSKILPVEIQPFVPKKIKNASMTLHFDNKKQPEKGLKSPERVSNDQINEVINVKTKLASRGILMSLKEIEVGLFSHDDFTPSKLPSGGESLINNPNARINLKSKIPRKK